MRPPRLPCDHREPVPGHGGRESPEHDWLKNRLAVIARNLGYSAVVPEPDSDAVDIPVLAGCPRNILALVSVSPNDMS